MRYSLRQLEVFLATARHQNISLAAQELAMSQSAASGSLKALESQFDIQLFDRVGKHLRLNALGEALRGSAEQLMENAVALEHALAGETSEGAIALGATLTIGNYLTLQMIADFKTEHPSADLTLDIANTRDIVHRVAAYELDMGLIEGEVHHPHLHIQRWRRDELVVFAAPDHPVAKAKKISDNTLRSLPWIVREPGSGTRQTFDRAMHGLLPELNIAMELEQPEAIRQAVELGLGVGSLSATSLEGAFARGTLVPLAVPQRDFSREWFIIVRADKFQSSTLKLWLTHCREKWSTA